MNQLAKSSDTGITLSVHVVAGSAKDSMEGILNGKLKIKIAAKSIEGAANKSLCQFLAQFFAVSKSSVTLLKGEHSRDKLLFIKGDNKLLLEKLHALINADQET
jgi:uncharacterized protein (TIGR00251 family)